MRQHNGTETAQSLETRDKLNIVIYCKPTFIVHISRFAYTPQTITDTRDCYVVNMHKEKLQYHVQTSQRIVLTGYFQIEEFPCRYFCSTESFHKKI